MHLLLPAPPCSLLVPSPLLPQGPCGHTRQGGQKEPGARPLHPSRLRHPPATAERWEARQACGHHGPGAPPDLQAKGLLLVTSLCPQQGAGPAVHPPPRVCSRMRSSGHHSSQDREGPGAFCLEWGGQGGSPRLGSAGLGFTPPVVPVLPAHPLTLLVSGGGSINSAAQLPGQAHLPSPAALLGAR